MQFPYKNDYRKRAIITRYWFETALDYKPWILGKQIKELPCLVYTLSVIQIALIYKPLLIFP